MVNFYIVRHGQTLLNSLGRAQGWTDSPLIDAGKQAAIDLGKKLKGIAFDAIYTGACGHTRPACYNGDRPTNVKSIQPILHFNNSQTILKRYKNNGLL